jgi:hypothetical protein
MDEYECALLAKIFQLPPSHYRKVIQTSRLETCILHAGGTPQL